MDPTLIYTKIQSSFDVSLPKMTQDLMPAYFSHDKSILTENIIKNKVNNLDPIFCDIKEYQNLSQLKNIYSKEEASRIRDQLNPFAKLGKSIFFNRAAVKLANIDAIYDFTFSKFGGYIEKQRKGLFSFADVCAGPGAFTEYLQWRLPESIGFGMTLKKSGNLRKNKRGQEYYELDWNMSILDKTRFFTFYGPDGSGDMYKYVNEFIDYVRKNQKQGVDLVTGDGGFDVDKPGDFERQEFLSKRLLLVQILAALGCLRPGGNFVCKIFDTVTTISAQLIFICACAFERIQIIKPVSSRPANAERYLVCLDARDNLDSYIELLQKANHEDIVNIFSETLPKEFIEWLTESNNISIERQKEYALKTKEALDTSVNQVMSKEVRYDTYKCRMLWCLPDDY